MSSNPTHWENTYHKPSSDIPWEIPEPPAELLAVLPSLPAGAKILDVGCGSGNYSIFLANQGFEVTGVDISPTAIAQARQKALAANVTATFIEGDVLHLQDFLHQKFDFILEYSLLHHIDDADLDLYIRQFPLLLNPDGQLLMVCYTPEHRDSQGKRRVEGEFGNVIFFRPKEEIITLYEPLQLTEYSVGGLGKRRQHPAHVMLFENRSVPD